MFLSMIFMFCIPSEHTAVHLSPVGTDTSCAYRGFAIDFIRYQGQKILWECRCRFDIKANKWTLSKYFFSYESWVKMTYYTSSEEEKSKQGKIFQDNGEKLHDPKDQTFFRTEFRPRNGIENCLNPLLSWDTRDINSLYDVFKTVQSLQIQDEKAAKKKFKPYTLAGYGYREEDGAINCIGFCLQLMVQPTVLRGFSLTETLANYIGEMRKKDAPGLDALKPERFIGWYLKDYQTFKPVKIHASTIKEIYSKLEDSASQEILNNLI